MTAAPPIKSPVVQAAIDALERMCPTDAYVEVDDQGRPRMVQLRAAPRPESLQEAIAAVAREGRSARELTDEASRIQRELQETLPRVDREREAIERIRSCEGVPETLVENLLAIQKKRAAEAWDLARRQLAKLFDEAAR